jgi:hypothetical protein
MIKNELNIQTIATKPTDLQADRVLQLGLLTEGKEKAYPSHFLKFRFARLTNGSLGFARHTSPRFAKPQNPFFANAPANKNNFTSLLL